MISKQKNEASAAAETSPSTTVTLLMVRKDLLLPLTHPLNKMRSFSASLPHALPLSR